MKNRDKIEKRLSRSAEGLAKAIRKKIDRMLRSGMNLSEIYDSLKSFDLPPTERKKLEGAVNRSMEEIASARQRAAKYAGEGILKSDAIESIMAISDILIPDIRSGIRRYLQKEVTRAIASGGGPEQLRKRLNEYEFGEMKTLANTAIAQFNNNITFHQAEASGVETFLYYGPVAAETRPFCRAHAGNIFTLDEIKKMDNGQGLPVLESCGGYNCRHEWLAEPDAEIIEKEKIKIGKQTFLLDDESKLKLFDHDRKLYVEHIKHDKPADWINEARIFASTHDGLNPVITNTPSDGIWTNRMRTSEATGERLNNFEYHFKKHGNEFTSKNEYRNSMGNLINVPNAQLYADATGYIIFDRETKNTMIISKRDGQIESFFRWNERKYPDFFKGKLKTNKSLKYYIGEF